MPSRRQFAFAAGSAAFTALTARRSFSFATREVDVNVHPEEQIGVIQAELHGQFAEHLGTCIYGGLWVGKNSKIPNINGYRKQAVDYLAALQIPVLRWPGGCFADDYHWRNGIGQKRPSIVNVHWGNYTEDNSFGTHEFIGLCKLIGAEPYLAGNVGNGTPEELRNWMEYCNYPRGSTLADERAANGSPEPFNVKYWGVGNENWGCGGNMTGDEYAQQYRRFATYLHGFGDTKPFLIACGPSKNDAIWTERFFSSFNKKGPLQGYAMHYYSRGAAGATKFTAEQMRQQFATFPQMEQAILDQRQLMNRYDPDRKIGMLIDEWGVWDQIDPADEKAHGKLWEQITIRSAVAAALGLNVFHRNAKTLVMCNIAQMVNVLHALLLAEGDSCIRTPTYYVYEMMKPHRGQNSLRIEGAEGLSVSASRKDKDMTITLVNSSPDAAILASVDVPGATVGSARGRLLHDASWNDCNTFSQPDKVVLGELKVNHRGTVVKAELPPLAVATLRLQLS